MSQSSVPVRLAFLPVLILTALIAGSLSCFASEAEATSSEARTPKAALVEDVERLAWILEDAHPDPYFRGGGREAFRQRLEELVRQLPDEGMTREEFELYLAPFVASVGDAHTSVLSDYSIDWSKPGGVPLLFDIIEDGLFVFAVTSEDDRSLIGARLIDVEGVTVDELKKRLRPVQPYENEYGALSWLSAYGYLWAEPRLSRLLPEWSDKSSISVQLQRPDGMVLSRTFDLPRAVSYPPIHLGSCLDIVPSQKVDFSYSFMDDAKNVALLRVDGMMRYREAAEMWHNLGVEQRQATGREAYERYHGTEAPEDYEEVLAGIPSATETFASLAEEMKDAGTELLLIDLRYNDGGNSYMSNLLVYFLYGLEKLQSRTPGLEVKKYSDFYFEVYPNESLEEINRERDVPLAVGDLDTLSNPRLGVTAELLERREADLRLMDTFAKELESGKHDGYYLPEKVVVVCSSRTFSSGYTMMQYLHDAGATLVGTPSGQAGNCFGDILEFELPNSGVQCRVSHKYYEDYPDDPEKGEVLPVDHLLTYEDLVSYGFDGNSEILFALDVSGYGALVDSLRAAGTNGG